MPSRPVHRILTAAVLVICAFLVGSALAGLGDVAAHFRAGRYQDARDSLEAGVSGSRPGEEAFWRGRLATRPDQALDYLQDGLDQRGLAVEMKIRLALEVADIQFGRGEYRESLRVLQPLVGDQPDVLPGGLYLRAGLALRALGDPQRAREMLASVKPGDPVFHLARFYLGDIGLDRDDPALALRYFDSASEPAAGPGGSRIAAGRWRALRAEGHDDEAARLVADLQQADPGSLAMLEIRRLLRARQEEMNAAAAPDTVVETVTADRGRYALQLGAFSDRALALEFQKRHREALPDLRIDSVRDARGQFLYKVRTGAFVNPALARTEARRLADQLGIDVIVADLSAPGPGN